MVRIESGRSRGYISELRANDFVYGHLVCRHRWPDNTRYQTDWNSLLTRKINEVGLIMVFELRSSCYFDREESWGRSRHGG